MGPNSAPGKKDTNSQSKCPTCDNHRLQAVYGLPIRDLANEPTVKLMGCLMECDMPEWFCPKCDEPQRH
ncbi:MAG: hypothetical protein RL343_916 [Actinomycetota bacterium]|jgi:hypothetical protein